MKSILKLCLVGAVSLFAISAHADNSLAGSYSCQGFDPFGNQNYTSPITITGNGDTYTVQWLNSKGYPILYGTGIMIKNLKNVFSVVFWDPKKADYFGNEIFEVKPDGSLHSTWTLQSESKIGTEDCTKS